MSCNGLSITFNNDNIVSISIDSKYSDVASENTGIPCSINSFSYIGADCAGLLSNIAISL